MRTWTNKIAALLLASVLLSSCGIFRKAKIDTSETKKSADSLSITEKHIDSSATFKSSQKETIDTTVEIKGSTQNGSKPIQDIIDGDSLVLEDTDQTITIKYDKATKNLKATGKTKDRKVAVKMTRETNTEHSTDIKRSDIAIIQTHQEESAKIKKKETEAKAGPDYGFWIAIWIGSGMVLLIAILFYRKKYGNFFKFGQNFTD